MKRLAVLLLLVVACGAGPNAPTRTTYPTIDLGWSEVREVVLSDGTRCAVYVNDDGGGITCDWGER